MNLCFLFRLVMCTVKKPLSPGPSSPGLSKYEKSLGVIPGKDVVKEHLARSLHVLPFVQTDTISGARGALP